MTDLLIQQVSRLFHESTILIMEQVAEQRCWLYNSFTKINQFTAVRQLVERKPVFIISVVLAVDTL